MELGAESQRAGNHEARYHGVKNRGEPWVREPQGQGLVGAQGLAAITAAQGYYSRKHS